METKTNPFVMLTGILGIAFTILKLTGSIDWSWYLVTAPFWGAFIIVVFFATVMVLNDELKEKEAKRNEKNKKK